jgi:hypothetical protein
MLEGGRKSEGSCREPGTGLAILQESREDGRSATCVKATVTRIETRSKTRDPRLTRRPGVCRCPPEQFSRLAVRILVPPLSQPALRVGHVIVIRVRLGSGPGRAEEGEGGDEQGRGEHGWL